MQSLTAIRAYAAANAGREPRAINGDWVYPAGYRNCGQIPVVRPLGRRRANTGPQRRPCAQRRPRSRAGVPAGSEDPHLAGRGA